ncbi:hypothetical protein HME9302_02437 [Alteripontixanthobacter maritimus]|uniref:Peptidase M48 domain-containing protein n=1 Tax=Alteripontixanthobacter maritimus TaxID=2161824 RepID=A0A369QFZ7_9SPHN|nr:hypothetical protein [Alteripontixanthobacter maritimus]RDC61218.1 hypothetical protein HME9302_02437 [Alteripontixanthobacter maritimus]
MTTTTLGRPVAVMAAMLAIGATAPAIAQEVTGTRQTPLVITSASNDAPTREESNYRRSIAKMQSQNAALQTFGYRLAKANAPFCSRAITSIGILLHDRAAYDRPDIARRMFHAASDIGVQAVAGGSAAARASIPVNAAILAVDGVPPPEPQTPLWRRLTAMHDAIDASLMADGSVAITWTTDTGASGASITTLTGDPVCRTRFEIHPKTDRASADGERVIFGTEFAGFDYAPHEFAAAIAHELAHNILAHRARLNATERTSAAIRVTEREADLLSPWLLANAGYPPRAAEAFMRRWGPDHGGGLFRKRTHDSWQDRAAAIGREMALIESAQAGQPDGTKLDWRLQLPRIRAAAARL